MASEPSWYHGIEEATGIDLDGDGIIGAPGKAAAPSSEDVLAGAVLLQEDDFEEAEQVEEKPKEEALQVTKTRRTKAPSQRTQWSTPRVGPNGTPRAPLREPLKGRHRSPREPRPRPASHRVNAADLVNPLGGAGGAVPVERHKQRMAAARAMEEQQQQLQQTSAGPSAGSSTDRFMVPRTIPKMVLAESFVYGTALKQALTVPVESLTKSTTSNSPSPPRSRPKPTEAMLLAERLDLETLLMPPNGFHHTKEGLVLSRQLAVAEASANPGSSPVRLLVSPPKKSRPRSAPAGGRGAHRGVQSHISRAKLQLREGSELDSPKCGELPVSSMVSVLEQAKLPDGTLRARVAKFGSQMPLGWVSTQGKDELRNLIPFDWTRFARMPRFSASPEAAAPAPAAEAPAADAPPKKPRKMLLSRAPSCLKRLQGQHGMPGAGLTVAAPAAEEVKKEEPDSPSSPVEKGKGRHNNEDKRFKVKTAAELQTNIVELETELTSETDALEEIKRPRNGGTVVLLKMALGGALMDSTVKISELVKTWGTDSKGRSTGEISMMEFRKQVRRVQEWKNVKDIDGLFSEIDVDNGGTLDTQELGVFFKQLKEDAGVQRTQIAEVQERIDVLRGRIEFVQEVASTTEEAEFVDKKLKNETNDTSIASRLGNQMLRKATKIADLVGSWEATDGTVNKKQFRKNVRTFGIDGDDDAMDELFDELDENKDGILDTDEVREALTNLREASIESDKEAQRLRKVVDQAWKQAKASQIELRKRKKNEEAEEKLKKEAAEAAAAEAERLKEVAAAAKAAKAEEKRLRKAEERAEYEAKIAARREKDGAAGSAGKKDEKKRG